MKILNTIPTDIEFKKYNSIVWDLDGTLINSEPFHIDIYLEVLKQYGYEIDKKKFKESISRGPDIIMTEMGIPDNIIQDIQTEKRTIFRNSDIFDMIPVIKKSVLLLKKLYNLNIPQGLITNSSLENIKPIFKHKLESYFSNIITRDYDNILKPNPQKARNYERYIIGDNILYIGDSETDRLFCENSDWDYLDVSILK